ncbi:unnamed protein product [Lactuca virosa]|uniref:GAGA-binding transcriptional activator n=1 Tax=Lactuca virosa TaxID=75947 RepID=A0AAU9P004_9ASTR|nr:unnamed protein product [Lactuca virosa]
MQAIKEKISDIRGLRKSKSDTREEQHQAELERAQSDQLAQEARLIRQAEAAMGLQTEEFIYHGPKLTGDHLNKTGYGNGLNNRHVADHSNAREHSGYDGAYATSPNHDSRKMAIHHKCL